MKLFLAAVLIVIINVASCAQQQVYPERCTQPLETGPCRAAFQKFGFDPATGACKQFIYGGCQGNTNRFDSQRECELVCVPMHG